MKELFGKVTQWANDRNLINGSDAKTQFIKYISELGELSNSYSNRNLMGVKDGVGDCCVVLIIICSMYELKFDDIDFEYIKNQSKYEFEMSIREGHTPDSLFVSSLISITSVNGTVGDSIIKKEVEMVRIYIPAIFLLLSLISHSVSSTIDECLQIAYDEIKDRKGVMYNGTFIKSTDSRYEEVAKLLKLN